MKAFTVILDAFACSERLENVVSFVGEDDSGSFGLLANHARMMTCLSFGLGRVRYATGELEYLALPGGLLYFVRNELRIATRNYARSLNYDEILGLLDRELAAEEENLRGIRDSLRRLDESIFKRLLTLRLLGQ